MKNIIKLLACLVLTATLASSCKKEISTISYLGGTSPVLTATGLSPIVMTKADENKTWNTFSWTNPNYRFSTGISSHDVTYTLQFDTTGSNFTNPNIQEIAVAKELSKAMTIKEINTAMAKLGLTENRPHNMEVRVKSTLTNSSAPLYSNVLKSIITNYVDVAVPLPASGTLFITGNALASDWTNSPPATQKFTKVSNTLYTLTVPLIGGNSYTFLATFGSWDDKYSIAKKNDPNTIYGGDFQSQGNDILAPPVSGNYKIEVDFKIGKFTVTKL